MRRNQTTNRNYVARLCSSISSILICLALAHSAAANEAMQANGVVPPNGLAVATPVTSAPVTSDPVPQPAVTSTPSASEATSAASGFFHHGLFGVCGGRSAWWGYLIGLVLYVPGLFSGAMNTGRSARIQCQQSGVDAQYAGGSASLGGAVGTALGYVIFWGMPGTALGWCLFGMLVLFAGFLAAAAAASTN